MNKKDNTTKVLRKVQFDLLIFYEGSFIFLAKVDGEDINFLFDMYF